MTVSAQRGGGGGGVVERGGGGPGGGLADVIELILDKGLVIDVFVRVSLVGMKAPFAADGAGLDAAVDKVGELLSSGREDREAAPRRRPRQRERDE